MAGSYPHMATRLAAPFSNLSFRSGNRLPMRREGGGSPLLVASRRAPFDKQCPVWDPNQTFLIGQKYPGALF